MTICHGAPRNTFSINRTAFGCNYPKELKAPIAAIALTGMPNGSKIKKTNEQ